MKAFANRRESILAEAIKELRDSQSSRVNTWNAPQGKGVVLAFMSGEETKFSYSLDAIGITSSNLKSSIEFYTLLGLELPRLNADDQHVEAMNSTGLRVMLESEELIKKTDENWVRPVGQRTTMAFLCESPSAVDEAYQKIFEAGFKTKKEPWDAFRDSVTQQLLILMGIVLICLRGSS